ncbi:MAG: acetyl-CoA carboxylase biotin carboxylase subunit [Armatimonadota bacterium]|nr:acetyl-CoA carboxylase biotin carboxylase subunit [Armatimonadota bacterium]
MFSKVLIANRGEIACRIIRACHELGARAVAVYSEADKESMHVQMADEAVCVGAASNTESYLNMPNVLMAAVITGADAVHPGYGYFSERENFADALQALGVAFIGPPVEAIARMGDKASARAAAMEANCPVVPGSAGILASSDEGLEEAERLGYPVLIKASAGGGGKGIRRADNADEFVGLMRMAMQEAEASFGSGDVYLEKVIDNPRHVEVQVMADKHGSCVYLGERECSIQNLRHQKMLEEAPFSLLCEETRQEMGEAAVRLASAVGYVNAGTIEFLMDADGNYYFIEMNTRLQVEHPVTEQTTGIDIVQTMLRVAAGDPLPFSQADIECTGHSIEARITAEDSTKNFAPSCGTVTLWQPPARDDVRMESHIYEGFVISPFYDPMIAKLIVTGADRDDTIARLKSALADFRIEGIKTNIPFLKKLIEEPAYLSGDFHTGTVPELMKRWNGD